MKKTVSKGNRSQNQAKKQLTICEREISKAEERIQELDAQMIEFACDYEKLNDLCKEKEAAQAQLDELYDQWTALAEEVEG